jgi:hypothetical protein
MEKRYFSCNSDSFTKEHNYIMNELLWCYSFNREDISWEEEGNFYYPISAKGLKILEHLRDCDLIEEVTNND